MKEELVSIIIPVYNAEKYIKETIKTVKNQTYKNLEIIFIDDCSTDKSKEIIKENLSTNMILIELSNNLGTARARNEGIKLVKGKYLSFLDADDLWEDNKIEKQITFMKKNGYCFSYTAFKFIDESNKKQSRKINIQERLEYSEALKNIKILPSSVMIDLEQLSKEDCFMVKIINHEDVATWWRILRNGYIAYGLNEALVYYRKHREAKTYSKLKSAKYRWKLYREEEKFSIPKTIYYFTNYIFYALIKRI